MDLNEKITPLGTLIGCPVAEDIYSGKEQKYITFTYEDERPSAYGDNDPVADIAYLMVNLFVPNGTNYMTDKHKIRDYLEGAGFKVTAIRTWVDGEEIGISKVRRVLFEINYTQPRI